MFVNLYFCGNHNNLYKNPKKLQKSTIIWIKAVKSDIIINSAEVGNVRKTFIRTSGRFAGKL